MSKSNSLSGVLCIIVLSTLFNQTRGNDISVQGTELVYNTITTLESALVHIGSQDKAQTIISIEKAEQIWQTFVDYHTMIYEHEVTASDDLRELISRVSQTMEIILEACDEITETQDITKIEEVTTLLNTLAEYTRVPVLFDFTGAACKSCKVMKARLQSVTEEVEGTARVVVIDVNRQKKFSKKFKIMLIPTLVFIDMDGEEAGRHTGEMEVQTILFKLAGLVE